MKDKIVKVMHVLAIIIGLLSFFALLGTAGMIEQDLVSLNEGFRKLTGWIIALAICVLIGNATKEEDDAYTDRWQI